METVKVFKEFSALADGYMSAIRNALGDEAMNEILEVGKRVMVVLAEQNATRPITLGALISTADFLIHKFQEDENERKNQLM